MKKLFVIIVILSLLIIANILINSSTSDPKKITTSLLEAISVDESLFSIEITNADKNIKFIVKKNCYEISSLGYCADAKKIKLLRNFLNNKLIDTYESNEENINRLGFNSPSSLSSMIINKNKTLYFGKLNQYDEIYILQENKIYKVKSFKGMLETSTKEWVDKSHPIISIAETDEFDIGIYRIKDNKRDKVCKTLEHKDLVLKPKYSILRNSFFDLYASDVQKIGNIGKEKLLLNKTGIKIELRKPGTDNEKEDLWIWKDEHLIYIMLTHLMWDNHEVNNELKFVIPNSVYDNINIYCEK